MDGLPVVQESVTHHAPQHGFWGRLASSLAQALDDMSILACDDFINGTAEDSTAHHAKQRPSAVSFACAASGGDQRHSDGWETLHCASPAVRGSLSTPPVSSAESATTLEISGEGSKKRDRRRTRKSCARRKSLCPDRTPLSSQSSSASTHADSPRGGVRVLSRRDGGLVEPGTFGQDDRSIPCSGQGQKQRSCPKSYGTGHRSTPCCLNSKGWPTRRPMTTPYLASPVLSTYSAIQPSDDVKAVM
jgi:hypothetical protein